MAHLAIDLLGGDKGSAPLLLGAIQALNISDDLSLTLLGDARIDQIPASVRSRVQLLPNSRAVNMEDSPVGALRNKSDSSMAEAIRLHASGAADAVVSAGNTGALVGFGVQILRLLDGITRPAIAAAVPTTSGKTWLLDIGATLQLSEQRLCELANLGAALCRVSDGKASPRVGLLNIGTEGHKGREELKAASDLMSASQGYDFVGYVEGGDLFDGSHDVVVCDGFSGNIAIKTAQGISKLLSFELNKALNTNMLTRILGSFLRPALKKFGRRIAPALYNGAPLLGLNGLIIKSHGNADEAAFANAILVAEEMADRKLVAAVNEVASSQDNK